MNGIIPSDEWTIKYEEGLDYIKTNDVITFIIPYVSFIIDNYIVVNIIKNGHELREALENYREKYES